MTTANGTVIIDMATHERSVVEPTPQHDCEFCNRHRIMGGSEVYEFGVREDSNLDPHTPDNGSIFLHLQCVGKWARKEENHHKWLMILPAQLELSATEADEEKEE